MTEAVPVRHPFFLIVTRKDNTTKKGCISLNIYKTKGQKVRHDHMSSTISYPRKSETITKQTSTTPSAPSTQTTPSAPPEKKAKTMEDIYRETRGPDADTTEKGDPIMSNGVVIGHEIVEKKPLPNKTILNEPYGNTNDHFDRLTKGTAYKSVSHNRETYANMPPPEPSVAAERERTRNQNLRQAKEVAVPAAYWETTIGERDDLPASFMQKGYDQRTPRERVGPYNSITTTQKTERTSKTEGIMKSTRIVPVPRGQRPGDMELRHNSKQYRERINIHDGEMKKQESYDTRIPADTFEVKHLFSKRGDRESVATSRQEIMVDKGTKVTDPDDERMKHNTREVTYLPSQYLREEMPVEQFVVQNFHCERLQSVPGEYDYAHVDMMRKSGRTLQDSEKGLRMEQGGEMEFPVRDEYGMIEEGRYPAQYVLEKEPLGGKQGVWDQSSHKVMYDSEYGRKPNAMIFDGKPGTRPGSGYDDSMYPRRDSEWNAEPMSRHNVGRFEREQQISKGGRHLNLVGETSRGQEDRHKRRGYDNEIQTLNRTWATKQMFIR